MKQIFFFFFLAFPCFPYDPTNVGNLIAGSSAFSKSSFKVWRFLVHVLLKPSLEDFDQNLISLWNEDNCMVVWTFFSIALLWDCGLCWIFQTCWHIEYSILTASSFRIWNSSAGFPSLLLALVVLMLPKAHLNSYSRMSDLLWVITPSWLSGSLRFFFCIGLLCILATSPLSLLPLLGPCPLFPLLCPTLHEMSPWYLQFSWRDSLA